MKMKKSKKRKGKKKFVNWIRLAYGFISITAMEGIMQLSVYAAEPQFVTGTKKLAEDLMRYMLGGVATITALFLVKNGYQWNIAGDEEKPKHRKAFFSTLFIGVGILISGSLVAWVFSYYQ